MSKGKNEEEKKQIMEGIKAKQVAEELSKRETNEKRKEKIKEALYKEYQKSYNYYMKGNMDEYKREQKKIGKIAVEGVNLGISSEKISKIAYRVYKEGEK